MEMIGMIRRAHSPGKKSEREISRATGLSRNTVAKWLPESVEGVPEVPARLARGQADAVPRGALPDADGLRAQGPEPSQCLTRGFDGGSSCREELRCSGAIALSALTGLCPPSL